MFQVKVEDVKGFLATKGYRWTGEIDGVKVTNENISGLLYRKSWFGGIKCGVTPFKFKMYAVDSFTNEVPKEREWSEDWMNYLIENRGKEYIPFLKKWCRLQKGRIKAEYAQREALLKRQMEELKKEEQVALDKFSNFDNIIANVQAEEHII